MHLSRIRFKQSIQPTQLARLVQDRQGYGLHRLFWGLFPDEQTRNFLFREELARNQNLSNTRRAADPIYYLLSRQAPDLNSPLFDILTKPFSPVLSPGDELSFNVRVNPTVKRNGKRHCIVMDAQRQFLVNELKSLSVSAENMTKSEQKVTLLKNMDSATNEKFRAIVHQGPYADQVVQTAPQILEGALKTLIFQALQLWWARKGQQCGFEITQGESGLLLEANGYQKTVIPEKGAKAGFNSVDLSGCITVTDVDRFVASVCSGFGTSKAFGCGLMLIKRA